MSQAAVADEAYLHAVDQLYALGQELAPPPPLPDGTSAPRRKWDLAHMRTLCSALGDPHQHFPSVLIAGTNGKGSTAATLASILSAAGYKTGLYTSPHLVRVNERIQILCKERHLENPDEHRHPERSAQCEVEGPASISVQQGVILSTAKDPFAADTPDTARTFPPHLRAPFIASSAMSGSATEIPDDTFARLFAQVDDTAASRVSSGQLPHPPSFFEVVTALAFLYFAEQKVDIAILEVGLGGRLDATNIVNPLLSVITDIALDHQEYLGNTLAEITREKAGILRPNGILITLPQHPEANQAIGEAAAHLNLHAISAADFIPPQLPASRSREAVLVSCEAGVISRQEGAILSGAQYPDTDDTPTTARTFPPQIRAPQFCAPFIAPLSHAMSGSATAPALPRNRYALTLDNQPLHVDSPLSGHHQQRNIALAIAAAAALRNKNSHIPASPRKISNQNSYNITNPAIEAGIRGTAWPGRLEFLPPDLLLDVAHNPAGAWTLRAAIARLPEDQPRTLIFSCLSDKDLTEMSRILFPLFDSSPEGDRPRDHIVLAPIANPRAARVEDLLAAAHALDVPAHAAPHLVGALAQARSITPPGGLIVATGSVYLVGAIRALALEVAAETA